MHGAFAKIVRRSIRGSLGRFLAIIGIVALGCGFFAGLQMSGPDMRASADRYYDGTHLWDIRLISTLGFSDDDVQRVRDIEGIADAMPSISTDVMMQTGDEQTAVRVSLLPDGASDGETSDGVTVASDDDGYLNRLLLRDGRWPVAEDECVVSADAPNGKPAIGQTVRVLYGTDALDETLDSREFTVVGTVSSSNYTYTVSFGSTTLGSGMIEQYLYAPRDAFAADAAYTEIYATVEGADAHESGSDDYEQAVTRVADRIERNADDLAATRLDDDAVLVTEKAAARLGLHVGDELTLYRQDGMGNATGGGARVPVTGIVENYVGNMVYVGPDAWRRVAAQDDGMDAELAYRTTYAVAPDGQRARDDLSADLREVPHLSTVGFTAISIETYSTMLSSINLIVVVLIVSAAALAFIVLYNLTNINIGERVREIATLKVLGFTRGEVNAYIFREIAILSLVGDLFGLALGTWLEGFVITTVEVDVVMFGRIIHPLSYLYAFLLTLVFSGVVVLAMRGRLDKVDMVESLKSVD